jgi:uncharacterized protein (DUF305 family)
MPHPIQRRANGICHQVLGVHRAAPTAPADEPSGASPELRQLRPSWCDVTLDFTDAMIMHDTLLVDMKMNGRPVLGTRLPAVEAATKRVPDALRATAARMYGAELASEGAPSRGTQCASATPAGASRGAELGDQGDTLKGRIPSPAVRLPLLEAGPDTTEAALRAVTALEPATA